MLAASRRRPICPPCLRPAAVSAASLHSTSQRLRSTSKNSDYVKRRESSIGAMRLQSEARRMRVPLSDLQAHPLMEAQALMAADSNAHPSVPPRSSVQDRQRLNRQRVPGSHNNVPTAISGRTSPIRLSEEIPRPSSIAITASELRKALPTCSRSPRLFTALEAFGLDHSAAQELTPLFLRAADLELKELAVQPDKDNADYWNLAKIADIIARDSPQSGLEKAFMWRFLSWAPSHVLESPDDDPLSGPLARLARIRSALDLRSHALGLDVARLTRRKIIMHVGPTNSGKTYHALKAMLASESGYYAGPLRLLAREVWDRINQGAIDGVPRLCNLVTGEERNTLSESARFTCFTVEMMNVHDPVEVAVIDEMQLIADPDRGPGWTSAFLALPAREIHVCGEETAVDIYKTLAEECGDEVEVHRYQRLTPLRLSKASLKGDLANVRPGDCVVDFSKSAVFRHRDAIEKKTGLKCTLAYGALPPEVRSAQARLFNEPDNGWDVIIATDAIGMGLNLKIKRIVFCQVDKFDGTLLRELTTSQIKQIAGRAGRFGMHEDEGGEVTTLHDEDRPILLAKMAAPTAKIERAYLMPPGTSLHSVQRELLPKYADMYTTMRLVNDFAIPGMPYLMSMPMQSIEADTVSMLPGIPLDEQRTWLMAPWPRQRQHPLAVACVQRFLYEFTEARGPVQLKAILAEFGLVDTYTVLVNARKVLESGEAGSAALGRVLQNPQTLVILESAHKVVTIYQWLHFRFHQQFPHYEEAAEVKQDIERASQAFLLLSKHRRNGSANDSAIFDAYEAQYADAKPENVYVPKPDDDYCYISLNLDGRFEATDMTGSKFFMATGPFAASPVDHVDVLVDSVYDSNTGDPSYSGAMNPTPQRL